jgi:hypothetical protein
MEQGEASSHLTAVPTGHFEGYKLRVRFLCLLKHHAKKMHGSVEVEIHGFLISVIDGDEWSVSRTGRFTPREPSTG